MALRKGVHLRSAQLSLACKARKICNFNQVERYSSHISNMTAWQIHDYGDIDQLSLTKNVRTSTIRNPSEMLVKVHAASVNPIDIRMLGGYGRSLINVLRKQQRTASPGSEFPLTLGRDFSGTIVETGRGISRFKVGDEIKNLWKGKIQPTPPLLHRSRTYVKGKSNFKVWGTLGAFRPGSHAQFTVTAQNEISKKPKNLTHVEAASIPYVAATTWAALRTVGQLNPHKVNGKRILILAGSGGIGTFAIQLAKCWGMHVTTTCGSDAADLVKGLGADTVVDYTKAPVWGQLAQMEKFDFILDPLGGEATDRAAKYLSPWNNSKLVTLNFPLLNNSDQMGVLPGLFKSAVTAGITTLKGMQSGGSIRWAAFNPNASALETVCRLVEKNSIHPVVHCVYPFLEAASAYRRAQEGHLRGKVVIDMMPTEKT